MKIIQKANRLKTVEDGELKDYLADGWIDVTPEEVVSEESENSEGNKEDDPDGDKSKTEK